MASGLELAARPVDHRPERKEAGKQQDDARHHERRGQPPWQHHRTELGGGLRFFVRVAGFLEVGFLGVGGGRRGRRIIRRCARAAHPAEDGGLEVACVVGERRFRHIIVVPLPDRGGYVGDARGVRSHRLDQHGRRLAVGGNEPNGQRVGQPLAVECRARPGAIAGVDGGRHSIPAGTSWHYSNAGYILLGQIIESSTGSTVSVELRDRFFEPLHLDTAFYFFEEPAPGGVAEGWFDISRCVPAADPAPGVLEPYSEFPWNGAMPEAGGVFASPEDLAAWARALYHDRIVLSADSIDQMLDFVPVGPDAEESPLLSGYGLGAVAYQPELFGGTVAIGHSGGDPFFYSAVSVYLPEYGVTIGAAENTETEDAFGLAIRQVVDVITQHVEPIG